MSSKLLTSCVVDIDTFARNPRTTLSNAEGGIVAISIDNSFSFYAISAQRLEKLLRLESRLKFLKDNDIALNNRFFEERPSTTTPIGKFSMYPGWHPDKDFERMAALWGIFLMQPMKPEELTAFIDYWKVENKVCYHIQWQQKLARSIQMNRSINSSQIKHDTNNIYEQENQIPSGFRG